ncbi:MAG: DNA polymerase IV [Oscillospiraceae bacterium]|nr:DNA polymerase IV [Oscillospiraceae bacterium]
MSDRTILHIDMNNFYASVECLYNPEIRNIPMVVGGDVEKRHGIVLSKNNIAKKFGIKTGEVIWQAKQKCPNLVSVKPNFERYLKFSEMARNIYNEYTDQVESFGLDECWLDVTRSSIFGNGIEIAEEIRKRIKHELGITASIGVSFNKIFAKLGSDYKKPDAITIINKENFKNIVWSLPASDLLYVGKATQKKFINYNIKTIGDLANADIKFLKESLGKWGIVLWSFANGLDDSEVSKNTYTSQIKSIGNGTTTPVDLLNDEDVKITLCPLCESVAKRLKKAGLKAKTVQIEVRDCNFESYSKQGKLKNPSNISGEIYELSFKLYRESYKKDKGIRHLGVRGTDLISEEDIQLDIFSNETKRENLERLDLAVDNLRDRFGYFIVLKAMCLNHKLSGLNPETHVIHPVSYF